MNKLKAIRTDYEDLREIDVARKFFDKDNVEIITDYIKFSKTEVYAKRDAVRVKFEYNNYSKGFNLYSRKVGLFKKPVYSTYNVLLKGDMFIVHNTTTGRLEVINTLDDTILAQRTEKHINLRSEAERLTKDFKEKLSLY